MNFCVLRSLKLTEKSKFRVSRIEKMSFLKLLYSKLISRKIWMTEKSWILHTVFSLPSLLKSSPLSIFGHLPPTCLVNVANIEWSAGRFGTLWAFPPAFGPLLGTPDLGHKRQLHWGCLVIWHSLRFANSFPGQWHQFQLQICQIVINFRFTNPFKFLFLAY